MLDLESAELENVGGTYRKKTKRHRSFDERQKLQSDSRSYRVDRDAIPASVN